MVANILRQRVYGYNMTRWVATLPGAGRLEGAKLREPRQGPADSLSAFRQGFSFWLRNVFTVGQRACARQAALASELAYTYEVKPNDHGQETGGRRQGTGDRVRQLEVRSPEGAK